MIDLAVHRCRFLLLAAALWAGTSAGHAQVIASDLLFTAIQPCRLVDTRIAGGAMSANVPRLFNVVGVGADGSLASQGGNPNGCPIPGFDPASTLAQVQAVAINLVAVNATGDGDLIAWPSDQPQPLASVLNFGPAGALSHLNLANFIILPVRQDAQGHDIKVVAQDAATHLVIDVIGFFSASSPSLGSSITNTSLGVLAGDQSFTVATENTAIGYSALESINTGTNSTAVGSNALAVNQGGRYNTAVGAEALFSATGFHNTALGASALSGAFFAGNTNTALGVNAGLNYVGEESSNIVIGNSGAAGDNDAIRIGDVQTQTFVAGIWNATSSDGLPVLVNGVGQLGTQTSSRRFKEDIANIDGASDDLMKLRPVQFRYKPPYDDGSRLLQYGLIAEEVARVYPDLVTYDQEGLPQAVRYHFVNAMLLNEVQKQHRTIAAQQEKLTLQQEVAADQRAQLAKLAVAQERQAGELARQRQLIDLLVRALPTAVAPH